jgi:hypothetical protein
VSFWRRLFGNSPPTNERAIVNTARFTRPEELTAIATAFPLNNRSFEWGVTLNDIERAGLPLRHVHPTHRSRVTTGGDFFGISISQVELMHVHRSEELPIEQVWYAISHDPSMKPISQVRALHQAFVERWGTPNHGMIAATNIKPGHEGSVVARPEWRVGGVIVGISWYGSKRKEQHGFTIGMVTAHWHDEKAIAAPFVVALNARQTQLDGIKDATVAARVRFPTLPFKGIRHYHFDAIEHPENDPALVNAQRALYNPDLLVTPPALRALTHENEWTLWRSAEMSAVGISTPHDTVFLLPNETETFRWTHVTPARFSGHEHFKFGSLWSIQRSFGTSEQNADIEAFAATLKTVSQICYEYEEEMDTM